MTSNDDNDLASLLIGHLADLYDDSEIRPDMGWETELHDAVEGLIGAAVERAVRKRLGSSAEQAEIAKGGE